MGIIKFAFYLGAGVATYQVMTRTICHVDKNECVVIFDRLEGVRNIVYEEGFHILYPFIQIPVYFKVNPSSLSFTRKYPTKDSENPNIKFDVTYKPIKEDLPKIYLNYGKEYAEKIIPSLGYETAKEITKNYQSANLALEKDEIRDKIKEKLTQRALDFFITIDDVEFSIDESK